ncbi:MAG: PEP-CTERM sorting domain-containing protein [Planctomycetota bacterium]
MKFRKVIGVVLVSVLACSQAVAQYTFDWETDLDGWTTSGFGNGSEFVALSPTGATGGSAQALSFGHSGGDFSWDASLVFGAGEHPIYGLLSDVANNPTDQKITFDVTYLANDLPTFSTFANLSFSLQSDNGFKQVDGVAEINTAADQTLSVSIPLDGPTAGGDISGFASNSSFYRLTIALNTDANLLGGPSTVYIDNLTITPEPTTIVLVGMASSGLLLVRRRKSSV